ncbi:MAG: mannanase [Bacteroidota bacterium]
MNSLWMPTTSKLMAQENFIYVEEGQLKRQGKPYRFIGTNFWYGMNLGFSDQDRLVRELDQLQRLGIQNLRIMATSEGPLQAPWCMQPTLQVAPYMYEEDLLVGLDFLLVEMAKRRMTAVVCLGNFWPWSGGMAQYVSWMTGKAIPYPPPAENGNWGKYQLYAARFYKNKKARAAYAATVKHLVSRINTLTGIPYSQDATIMSWQLANEPRGIIYKRAFRKWVRQTAQLIKSIDPQHLVSIGSEGTTPYPMAGTQFERIHKIAGIDYATFHMWIQNWEWFDPFQPEKTYPEALSKAMNYLEEHEAIAQKLGIPLVLEEFGIARDGDKHAADAPVAMRQQYFREIFDYLYRQSGEGSPLMGLNFWAWGGEGRPRTPKAIWRLGDDFIGDPPHEYQGWYSVYNDETTTLSLIQEYTSLLAKLP